MLRPDTGTQRATNEHTLVCFAPLRGFIVVLYFVVAQVLPPKSLPSQHHERLDAAREVGEPLAFIFCFFFVCTLVCLRRDDA